MAVGADLRNYVAANARTYRERRGQTQEETAELAGVSPRYYSDLEAGRVNMTLETLRRLSSALSVEASELLRPARLRRRGPGRPVKRL